MPLFDKKAEQLYLTAFIAGRIDIVLPLMCTDLNRVVATILAEGRPESEANLSLALGKHGVNINIANLFDVSALPDDAQLDQLVEGLSTLAVRRGVRGVSDDLVKLTQDPTVTGVDLRLQAEQMLEGAFVPLDQVMLDDETARTKEWFLRHLAGIKDRHGDQTYYLSWAPLMGKIIGPLGQDTMLGIAGYTSYGKTIWSTRIALDLAQQGARVITCSPDMGPRKLWMRFISALSGLPYLKIDRHSTDHPTLTQWEKDRLMAAHEMMSQLQIRVERTNIVPELIGNAKRFGADALFVDYAYLFRMPSLPSVEGVNYEQIAASVLQFAALTKDMLVVVASQVHGTTPDLYALEWGKNLPNRADIVLWLDRNKERGITNVHVLKNRGGPLGQVPYYVLQPSMQPIELLVKTEGYSL